LARSSTKQQPKIPSKDELLSFIGAQAGKVGTREIARAFGLKNADRAALKHMLRELSDEGHLERRRKKLHHAGTLPSVVLADVTGRDADGELIAVPTEWDEDAHGAPPRIRIASARRAKPGETAGVGDRALLRIVETGEPEDGIRHSGRVIKLIDRARQRVLGIYRPLPSGGGRLLPVDKKQHGRELAIPAGSAGEAKEGDLVAVEIARSREYGLPTGRVV
jgi:ribonuclease R